MHATLLGSNGRRALVVIAIPVVIALLGLLSRAQPVLYAFYDLPPGRYEFSPDLPLGKTLSWFIGSDRPQVPFELRGTGCQERDGEVFASGSIQGRVLDQSNNPLANAFEVRHIGYTENDLSRFRRSLPADRP